MRKMLCAVIVAGAMAFIGCSKTKSAEVIVTNTGECSIIATVDGSQRTIGANNDSETWTVEWEDGVTKTIDLHAQLANDASETQEATRILSNKSTTTWDIGWYGYYCQ